jgi:hypothetical protein
MLLALVEPEVLKLYLRSIIIFFFLFLHNEPVLSIIKVLVVKLWGLGFAIHLQLPIMIHLWMTYILPLALV